RRRGAAALAAGERSDRLRRRRASALRPRTVRALPGQHPAQAQAARARDVQGHDRAVAPGPGDGDRRTAAGARRADARPGHPLSQAVLPAPAGGLLRRAQDHRHHHPPGRGDRAHPHRRDVHPRRQGGAGRADGRRRRALRRDPGQCRPGGGRAPARPDRRAFPALRQDRDAVRRRGPGHAVALRRDPHPGPGRPVRRDNERNLRMNAAPQSLSDSPRPATAAHVPAARRFGWLLRREFWEHKGGFLWAPLVAGAVSLLLSAMGIVIAMVAARDSMPEDVDISLDTGTRIQINGMDLGMLTSQLGHQDLARLGDGIDLTLILASGWPFVVLGFVMFFYCLGALYDERKDRSVLFWKSLPLSDSSTVLSKVASVLLVAPLIATIASILT